MPGRGPRPSPPSSSPAFRCPKTTTSGQCKKLDDGSFPSSTDQVVSVRPLCRHNIIRRHVARRTARAVTRHRRSMLELYGQYGNSPSGIDAAVHSGCMSVSKV